MELQDSGRDLVIESADVAFNTVDMVEEPKTFDEAYNHPNANHRLTWQEAISKEFDEMSAKRVWKKFKSRNCPTVGIVLRVNGSLKLSATEFIVRVWWRAGIVRYPELIFRRVLHQ
jgi:hypothetical protein